MAEIVPQQPVTGEEHNWGSSLILINGQIYYQVTALKFPMESSELNTLFGQGTKPTGFSRGNQSGELEGSMSMRKKDYNQLRLLATSQGKKVKEFQLQLARTTTLDDGDTEIVTWNCFINEDDEQGGEQNSVEYLHNLKLKSGEIQTTVVNGVTILQ